MRGPFYPQHLDCQRFCARSGFVRRIRLAASTGLGRWSYCFDTICAVDMICAASDRPMNSAQFRSARQLNRRKTTVLATLGKETTYSIPAYIG